MRVTRCHRRSAATNVTNGFYQWHAVSWQMSIPLRDLGGERYKHHKIVWMILVEQINYRNGLAGRLGSSIDPPLSIAHITPTSFICCDRALRQRVVY